MKKTTLKISFFLLLTMLAFQGYTQAPASTIVELTKYNIRNAKTGDYLKATGDGVYEFAAAVDNTDVTFNFFFGHHDSVDPGADGILGTGDDIIHNYLDDWNIQNDTRGIMRAANPATIHTNFKYTQSYNSNGGHKTDKRFVETLDETTFGFAVFRFSPLSDGTTDRFLYQQEDGLLVNLAPGDMTDEDRSYWALFPTTVLSNEKFDVSSIFVSNPVKDVLSINGLTSNVKSVSLYSLIGKEIISKELSGESSINLNISSLSSGMYIVDFKGENGNFTKKIIKQ